MSEIKDAHIDDFTLDDRNANTGTDEGRKLLSKSVQQLGLGRSIVSDRSGKLIAGNKTYEAAKEAGIEKVVVVETDGDTLVVVQRTDLDINSKRGRELALADNKVSEANLRFDEQVVADLAAEFDINLEEWGFELPEEEGGGSSDSGKSGVLNERFIVPPFTVLDTRQGYWQDRKKAWLELGFQSEAGRSENLTYADSAQAPGIYKVKNQLRNDLNREPTWDEVHAYCDKHGIATQSTTSIFDPVLCELAYRWFIPAGGHIYDPFAGGSVRGLVAAKLGYQYTGVDLRSEQVEENRQQALSLLSSLPDAPVWICGNSLDTARIMAGQTVDFVFTCPPYFDLEVYSDDPSDLSNMEFDEFSRQYIEIIRQSVALLKPNRFACLVIGDVRDQKGYYRNLIGLTVDAFEAAGARYYNEAVLVTQVASAAIRANQFLKGRKLVKTHQNVLVFYKGDPKQIKQELGDIEVSWPEETD
ncbi:hypothetical protein WBJ53_26030 [Spirosoma sp. SC4-14]|uniref:hypothetical protein n=1 Tax=Spirosoma sp. SC4-14 TaxID=3128900 RepID=UPI0030D0372F